MSLKEVIQHYPNITAFDWVLSIFILIFFIALFAFCFRIYMLQRNKIRLTFFITSILLYIVSNYYVLYYFGNAEKLWQRDYLIPYLISLDTTKKEVKNIEIIGFTDVEGYVDAKVTLVDHTKYTGIVHLTQNKKGNFALYKKIDVHFSDKYPKLYEMSVNIDNLKINIKNRNIKKDSTLFYPGVHVDSGTSIFLFLFGLIIFLLPTGMLYEFFETILPVPVLVSSPNELEDSPAPSTDELESLPVMKNNRIIRKE
jgi:hypothetical protein